MDINGYDLSRNWFNWSFENPELISPNHTALYFFCIEHCNRLGWKQKFGLPTTMAKEAIGIKSYNTYIKTLNDLVEWGFIKLIEKSTNQYSANIIAISKFNKANDKALDKALIKHGTKQRESTQQSIDSIDKQETSNKEPITKNNTPSLIEFLEFCKLNFEGNFKEIEKSATLKYKAWIENKWRTGKNLEIKNWKSTLLNTIPHLQKEFIKKQLEVYTNQDQDYSKTSFFNNEP